LFPSGGAGLFAFHAFTKDDVSPVRAAAANALAKDPDPQTTKALVQAVSDKSCVVRVGALQAIAKRGDLPSIQGAIADNKDVVSYAASAAVIALTNLQRASKPEQKKKGTRKNG
jgi:HEAT repeat protein